MSYILDIFLFFLVFQGLGRVVDQGSCFFFPKKKLPERERERKEDFQLPFQEDFGVG